MARILRHSLPEVQVKYPRNYKCSNRRTTGTSIPGIRYRLTLELATVVVVDGDVDAGQPVGEGGPGLEQRPHQVVAGVEEAGVELGDGDQLQHLGGHEGPGGGRVRLDERPELDVVEVLEPGPVLPSLLRPHLLVLEHLLDRPVLPDDPGGLPGAGRLEGPAVEAAVPGEGS